MLAYLTDEDFHGPILDGLRLHYPDLDFVRVVDIGLSGADDATLLGWAAMHDRVMVSHDVNTMTDAANRRVALGLRMTGLIIVRQSLSTMIAIAQLQFIADVCSSDELANATIWLPI